MCKIVLAKHLRRVHIGWAMTNRATQPTDRRASGYTPEEQIEIARDEAAARAAQEARLDAWLLGCECGDTEGEAY